jgi:hypothetical protein
MSPLSKEIVNLKVKLIAHNITYPGFIESLCGDGIYMRTLPENSDINLMPGTIIDLKFQTPSGEPQVLRCSIKWLYKTPPHGLTTSIGLHILNPVPSYERFLSTL